MIRILFIGDIVRDAGRQFLADKLPGLKRLYDVDLVIANGENAAPGNGIQTKTAELLLSSGVDFLTTGNHVYRHREFYEYLDGDHPVVRPANYPDGCPGLGWRVVDMVRYRLCVINLMGTAFMEPLDNPFSTMDRILNEVEEKLILVDFHAESTGEKRAMGYYLAGRVSALLGTHTHVPTADECILGGHTAYLTDVGMTGPSESVLGVRPESVIERMRLNLPARFDPADGPCRLDAALLELDEKTGRALSIERVNVLG